MIKNVPTSNFMPKIFLVLLLVAGTFIVFQLFGMRFVLVEVAALFLYWLLSMKNGNDSSDGDHDNPNSFRIEF